MGSTTRSVAFAAVIGATLVLVSGAAAQDRTRIVQNPPPQGRYAIYFGPFARADVYLLDTQTGKIWRPVTYTDIVSDPEVWVAQDRVDDRQQMKEWVERQRFKPGASRGSQ